ncbi:multifunctional oxoglutarate decarboxylase/oxoglutarate dehydrogenase thiamine pyrophosphate-binding subunit/dihydrolipoyllysine-residue succinyltransferase subunit [Modestobacter sp. VKM Ac-2984]|uniref:multifunctional oxoglutarate decarboxylase/oxoglutarate dehydrogenase thiamine pyrophosphate-binding subunit/dihydrolipoyllysine-residue succinyltransferase subunit n=1 Tax=Modestobacter sp. VKM Ac-2984 TaxID=3004138 RepID=UPI0022AAC38A|nr:multifunctional oxoglutarate decarboxylase/oxoglutarate dehydrogenase thiamine pyrophosphate-binding subunit/dihydrolipoyllysine-residue succinyltransferase subunit [Modestobacter sp. VKM Ac-2984]MCZ2816550.1 multifunctional oxoglutarate decarboxylase/oxoglutarate dehydrogenase thiamine pyrophosphate-binding subunit/dihydrolipoyllysine-residue succinyltransferase subunit [Modestobacter sp. VKM Ac-2984]
MSSSQPSPAHSANPVAGFGTNEWLVEEMYQQYLADPRSVDQAWHDFFADYRPGSPVADGQDRTTEPAEPAEPAPSPEPSESRSAQAASTPSATTYASPAPSREVAPQMTQSGPAAPKPASASTSSSDESAQGASDKDSSDKSPADKGSSDKSPASRAAESDARSEGTVVARPAERASQQKPATPAKPVVKPGPGRAEDDDAGPKRTPLRGAAASVVKNMNASLTVPTATSVRAVPAKLMVDNRIVINNHLARARGGKISFTHLIGYALVRALDDFPNMNSAFAEVDGKPVHVQPEHVNFGLAIDLPKPDGTRSLVVASIKAAEEMDFAAFWGAYEEIIRRARAGKLTMEDFSGTTISLTNPGTIGTNHSVPRLTTNQGTIVGVGAMDYPAEFQGMSPEALAEMAVSKIITLTSTYDHRVIQGAESGDFLRRMHGLLLGQDGFYDDVFRSLRIPYEPVRWVPDKRVSHEGQIDKEARVIEVIEAYRRNGHLMADTDPLEFKVRTHPDLDIVQHGLTLWDLDRPFPVGGFAGERTMLLRDILGVLRNSYCRTVGIEYMHITDPEERGWLQERIEVKHDQPGRDKQKRVLGRLNAAEAFETFLQTKYVGQKRFSLEGGESVIPLLDEVLVSSSEHGIEEVAIGMAHRGRLNVLANVLGKSYAKIFGEFEGNIDPGTVQGSGDVKYHLGAEGSFEHEGRSVAVSLASNPSHLETVNPVLEGIVRAKQDMIDKGEGGFTVLPLLLHGDSAFAGQGVVQETLNLSQLRGYRTGGTVHVVINNQVGFTTSPAAARSSLYSTDVARMIGAPVFHVNGDDPEACVRVAKLAVDYRQEFKKDVVIDLVCYRRRGHNEGDDPSMTQPLMYDIIDRKRSVRKLYTEALVGRGDITLAEAEEALKDYRGQLERAFAETHDARDSSAPEPVMDPRSPQEATVDTAITPEVLKTIGDAHVSLPTDFTVHPKLQRMLERRAAMASEGGVDWAMGELLAFGSLLMQGVPVRLAGQDSRRGTFVQRHSVLIDRETASEHTPLLNLTEDQAKFFVYDSLLSEYAALGFEYGYSVANPKALVLWEAQFGDFVDGAQMVIDEFISSGEAKWGQRSGVVLLLPHGLEGQGPDHSSGRIERFLQLSAENNMTVANCSTPANYFHLLRRQALSEVHRPLVVFTPKSLLRAKAAVSPVGDFTEQRFRPVLPDPGVGGEALDASAVRRVLLCSGKISYELLAQREKDGTADTAILRVEQLYPLPAEEIAEALAGYPEANDVVWVQEEPANMGAAQFMAVNLPEHLPAGRTLRRVSRKASASPAVGSAKVHEVEQRQLVARAFAD